MLRVFFLGTIILIIVMAFVRPLSDDVPPGTVPLGDSLFVDIYEIKNADWREFMYWTYRKHGVDSWEYERLKPDSTVWKRGHPYFLRYFSDPQYLNFPIVGITYEQATLYCKWRTDRVNEFIHIKTNDLTFRLDTNYNAPKLLEYRLPTEAEWKKIASISYKKKVQKKILKGYINGNFLPADTGRRYIAEVKPAGSYYPNKEGIYDLFGNVAEMINRPGIAKGASFMNPEAFCVPDSQLIYEKPQNWLGFRCVCTKLTIETPPETEEEIVD